MNPIYLPSLNLDLTGGAYLDTGILFPFFLKDYPSVDVRRWVNDVHELVVHHDISVTNHIQREADAAFFHVPIPKAVRKQARHLARLVMDKLRVVSVPVADKDMRLSQADLSLLNRPDQSHVLVTADQYLFERDKNAILISWDNDKQSLSYVRKGESS